MLNRLAIGPISNRIRPEWSVIAVAVLVFGLCLGSNRTLTDHEALLAGSARQMVESGDWLVLRIGDRTWIEKPPLPYWLAAGSAIAFGTFNEWTMRLPSAIVGVVVVLLVMRLATRLFGPTVGLLSGLIQATCVYQAAYARLAESDVLLQAFVLGAIVVFQERETRRDELSPRTQSWLRLAFWVLIGLTNLSKGIAFGAVLVLLTCGGALIVRGDWRGWKRWWSPLGMTLAVMIAVAWPLAVVWREPTAWVVWSEHSVGRAAGTLGYTKPFWYYLTTWPTQLLPWTPFLLIATPASWRRARNEPHGPDRFVWWWALSQPAVLSLSSGKHHHYLIYALPALTPIMALGLIQFRQWIRDARQPLLRWTWSPVLTAVAWIAGGTFVALLMPSLRAEVLVVSTLLAFCGAAVSYAVRHRRGSLAWTAMFAGIICGHVYAQLDALPRRDPSLADKEFLLEAEQLADPDAPLVATGCQEIARHLFYAHRPMVGIWNPADVPRRLPDADTIYVITRGYAVEELAAWGHVEQIAQSRFTRRERNPQDRYTLFRVDRHELVAGTADHSEDWR
ncbi:MAG: glycosyltransferase family 39 protein [Planctomycetaceae bacterium]|nr:glycosyltransferase family 39 protein [Planctomycetaceae bacterium]